MRWSNHKLSTAAIAYAATLDPLATACAVSGCVFPDAIEMVFKSRPKLGEYPKFSKHHRRLSHWPWSYVVITVSLYLFFKFSGLLIAKYAAYIVFGSILHLLEDALSISGIPWKTPYGKRVGAKIYKTFTLSETFTMLGIVGLSGATLFFRNALTIDSVTQNFRNSGKLFVYLGTELSILSEYFFSLF